MFQVKFLSKSSRAIFSQKNSNFFQSNGKVKWEIKRNMNTKSKWVDFFERVFEWKYLACFHEIRYSIKASSI
jgi:hypothetical protein